jgi:hypothetical protein
VPIAQFNGQYRRLNFKKVVKHFNDIFNLTFETGSVVGPDPEFVEPLQNLTVTAGRDVKLQCSVKHLGSYKVCEYLLYLLTSEEDLL